MYNQITIVRFSHYFQNVKYQITCVLVVIIRS